MTKFKLGMAAAAAAVLAFGVAACGQTTATTEETLPAAESTESTTPPAETATDTATTTETGTTTATTATTTP